MVDGLWVTNPQDMNSQFFQFVKRKFQAFSGASMLHRISHLSKMDSAQRKFSFSRFTQVEVQIVVWSCSSDEALEPDGLCFVLLSISKRF